MIGNECAERRANHYDLCWGSAHFAWCWCYQRELRIDIVLVCINANRHGISFHCCWNWNTWSRSTTLIRVICWTGPCIKQLLVDDYVAWWRIHFSDLVFNCTYLNWCCWWVCICDIREHITTDSTRDVHQIERSYFILFCSYIHIKLKHSRNYWFRSYQWIIERKHTTWNRAGWFLSNPNWCVLTNFRDQRPDRSSTWNCCNNRIWVPYFIQSTIYFYFSFIHLNCDGDLITMKCISS